MNEVEPRFEFRIWGEKLDGPFGRLAGLAGATATLHSDEVYFVAEGCDDTNMKVRNNELDVKVLNQVVARCEQWQPWIKTQIPVAASLLTNELLPRLGVGELPVDQETYELQALVELMRHHPRVGIAHVSKQRTKYIVAGCLAETAIVAINRTPLHTVAIESADLDALCELRDRLELEAHENVNYPRAIRMTLQHTMIEPELGNGHGD